MRDLKKVLTYIINEVPKEESEFIEELNMLLYYSAYSAPEDQMLWDKIQLSLSDNIPTPTKTWHWRVLSIFTTRSVQELKVLFNTKYDPK